MSFFLPSPQYPSCILFQQIFGILNRNLLSFTFEWSMSTAAQLQLKLTFKQTRAPHRWLLRVLWMAFSLICSSWSTMWCFNQKLFLFWGFLPLHDMWLCICLQITSNYNYMQMCQCMVMGLIISVSLALRPLAPYLWWNCKCSCFRFQLMWTDRETMISQKVRVSPTFIKFSRSIIYLFLQLC